MTFANKCNQIFDQIVRLYHDSDDVDAVFVNPYEDGTIECSLARKNWIDAVQWHLEDIIRDEQIDPVEALALKRRIDRSNQDRTDLVEEWIPTSASNMPAWQCCQMQPSILRARLGLSTACRSWL